MTLIYLRGKITLVRRLHELSQAHGLLQNRLSCIELSGVVACCEQLPSLTSLLFEEDMMVQVVF